MSRPDTDLLQDIADAIRSIRSHLQHGPISVEIVMDAVAMRLLEIGEAVKGLSQEATATEAEVDWRGIAGMRDFVAHRYIRHKPRDHSTHDRQAPPALVRRRESDPDALEHDRGLGRERPQCCPHRRELVVCAPCPRPPRHPRQDVDVVGSVTSDRPSRHRVILADHLSDRRRREPGSPPPQRSLEEVRCVG